MEFFLINFYNSYICLFELGMDFPELLFANIEGYIEILVLGDVFGVSMKAQAKGIRHNPFLFITHYMLICNKKEFIVSRVKETGC